MEAVKKEEEQREKFRAILYDLAKLQITLKEKSYRAEIYLRLESLYHAQPGENSFRHFYSDIFTVLTRIKQGDEQGDIDTLGQNIGEIRKGYRALNTDAAGNPIDISDSIRKLYDHVSMDIARINYSDAESRKYSDKESGKDDVAQIKAEIKVTQGQLEDM